jgi:Lanthionine-containing peptide SapB precursor RamS
MALLDMQGMELKGEHGGHSDHGGGGGPHSGVSILLCDSAASTTLCL